VQTTSFRYVLWAIVGASALGALTLLVLAERERIQYGGIHGGMRLSVLYWAYIGGTILLGVTGYAILKYGLSHGIPSAWGVSWLAIVLAAGACIVLISGVPVDRKLSTWIMIMGVCTSSFALGIVELVDKEIRGLNRSQ
jgi:hypothetical protein